MSWTNFIKKPLFILGGIFAVSTAAYAFPWDIDLVDTPFFRGYEWKMQSPAEGTISQNFYRDHRLSSEEQSAFESNFYTFSANYISTSGLESPYSNVKDAKMLAHGEVMFRTYCQTCHGVKGTMQDEMGETWQVSQRWSSPIPALSAVNNGKIILSGAGAPKDEATLYLYIRNGFKRMPAYGHAMSDTDIWATTHYIKSLQGQDF